MAKRDLYISRGKYKAKGNGKIQSTSPPEQCNGGKSEEAERTSSEIEQRLNGSEAVGVIEVEYTDIVVNNVVVRLSSVSKAKN